MVSAFELEAVDRFVVGTIGMPGERTFFFQVAAPQVLLSFKAEKVQVVALVDAMSKMLNDIPASTTLEPPASWAPLDLPVFNEWPVGSIGIGYEGTNDRLVVVLEELTQTGVESSEARFFLTRAQAIVFATNARNVVSAGRPTCVLCSASIDTNGYTCACYN
jgi:uncharacterized repeat protein (TIGR03847 family)